jgi:predicted phage terminase large subunit-like protein|tara:strand:- start:4113 stop:5366 length:1254 start_codon:yes stop_codon:yes gene_type:complete
VELNVELLPWQQDVFNDTTRFKIVAAGRRTGKSRLAAWMLIINALQTNKGQVFYVAPTQGQARDIMWQTLLELAHPVIKSSHINNLHITLINGCTISLKGADRPETMRGVSLKFLVLDEYADMKSSVWEQILRPALADQKGHAMFIGTPMGRNHFYDLFKYAELSDDVTYKAWHFTSYDNPLLDPDEIDTAKQSMSSYAFRQEFLASFEALGSEIFREEWIKMSPEEPEDGDFYIAVDLAGFADVAGNATGKNKKLDETAIVIVKANTEGWWVADIIHGRWDIKKTAKKIFEAVAHYRPISVGIEKGALKNAVLPYLTDMMKSGQRFFRVEELTHGNKKKIDRVVWALQGRFEHHQITLAEGKWNTEFLDQLFQFPNALVHDDLVDALAYIDQLAKVSYYVDFEEEELEIIDYHAGY